MEPQDLYSIGLNPGAPEYSGEVAGAQPDGSIGGSDIGANAQDDQRVRDLIKQNDPESRSLVASMLTAQGSSKIVGGWRDTDWRTLQNFDEGASSSLTITGTNRSITHTGKRLLVSYGLLMDFSWTSAAAPYSHGSVSLIVSLYIDGNWISEYIMRWETGVELGITQEVEAPVGGVTMLTDPTVISAGAHTYRLDYTWGVQGPTTKANNSVHFQVTQEAVVVTEDTAQLLQVIT